MATSQVQHYITALGTVDGVSTIGCRCGRVFCGTERLSVVYLYERHIEEHLEDES